jgi:hypothetical protein
MVQHAARSEHLWPEDSPTGYVMILPVPDDDPVSDRTREPDRHEFAAIIR